MIEDDKVNVIFGCCLCSLLTFLICVVCIAVPADSKMKDFKKQAIERGFAEYKTDSDGVTVFTWKDAE